MLYFCLPFHDLVTLTYPYCYRHGRNEDEREEDCDDSGYSRRAMILLVDLKISSMEVEDGAITINRGAQGIAGGEVPA